MNSSVASAYAESVTLAPSHCPNCDAKITSESTQFCIYCGTQLPNEQSARPATIDQRFVALEAHAEYENLRAFVPSVDEELKSHKVMVGFLIFFVVMCLPVFGVFLLVGLATGPFLPLFMLIPGAVIGLGIFMLQKTMKSSAAFKRAEMRSWPGLIVDERSNTSGGGGRSRAHTSYYVTLQDMAGRRREFRARAPVAGKVGAGDMGVAYSKAEFLIDFNRVDV